MDVVVRVFPVTSTSLSIVFWGLFGVLNGALGSVCALSCVRFSSLFKHGLVDDGIAELVSVSCVVNFCFETVIIPILWMCVGVQVGTLIRNAEDILPDHEAFSQAQQAPK